jgi:PAS domain S-box-containing protein
MNSDGKNGHAALNGGRNGVALRASELRYRRLFESAKDGILILDAETGMVVDVNPFLIEGLGYSREQFLKKEIWELGAFKDIVANKRAFEELRRNEYIRYADKPLETADGRKINVEFVSNVYLVNGEKVIQCNIRDITDRKASQEKLHLLRALIDGSKDAIHVIDPETMRFLDVNESGCQALGYTRVELLKLTVSDVTVGVDQAMFDSTAARIEKAGHAVFESIHRRKDGSTFPVEVSLSLVRLNRRYLVAIVRDITERREAEKALRAEQALFAELGDAVPDNIYFKDRQSRFVRINAPMARNLGLRDAAAAVGKTDFDIFGGEHARQAFGDEQRIMATGEPMIGYEEKETWPDGHVSWVSSTKMPLRDSQARITGLVGISRDITGRVRSDARIREQNEILSNSREAVIIVNLANELTLWNRGAEIMFGWTAAEAMGHPPEKCLGVSDPGILLTLRAAVERDGFWRGELRSMTRDGREIVVDCRITQVRDAEGRPRARLSFLDDITEKKLLEEKYLHAQRLESIGMLAAGIAHDLNNVLAPIMFVAPLLRDSLSAPFDLKMLDTLEQSAVRGAGLVKQILGFVHRTTAGFQPTQVRHLAQDVVNLIDQTFPKSIKLRKRISTDLWSVLGDATQIHQVLINLCVNARDAMPNGGTLTITAANRRLNAAEAAAIPGARAGAWCMLEVADTGTGIPPEILGRIWDPFFTTKGEGKGTGLGLATVRGIVASHNGFIEVRTEVGHGTSFCVFLPPVEGELSGPASPPTHGVSQGQGEMILVVDDNDAIRETIAAILTKHGYRVASCRDGVDAITSFTASPEKISLVVTDVDMPRLGGVALARALSKLCPGVLLLAISGLSRSEADGSNIPEIRKLTHGFLLKPFNADDLLGVVHRLLHPLLLGSALTAVKQATELSGPLQ